MKLPIILSAMIAALAIPTFASQAGTEPAAPEAPAMENKEEGKMEGKEEGKKDTKKEKKHHAKGKHHHKHHGGSHEDRGTGPRDPNDRLPYDERVNNETACGGSDGSPVAGPNEQPGQKMP